MGALYMIRFPNGKAYIGITSKTASRRRVVHLHHARKGRAGALQSAIRKYGDSFELKVLLIANDWSYLCEMERRAIKVFSTKSPDGYNLTDGGEGCAGMVRSAEYRARMSEAKRGKKSSAPARRGWSHTAEAKAKISEARKGHPVSEETRRKIGISKQGNRYNVGRPCNEAVRKKISEAQKGRPLSTEHRHNLIGKHKGKPWSAARRAAQECRVNG